MIDVYLYSGFLGSGKTSLLLNSISQLKTAGRKPAVLMNEFGEIPVDSDSVAATGEVPLKELLSGCICCTGSEKTEAQLQALLEDYEDIDVILIETTGAAHPVEALDAVYSPLFSDRLRVKGIVTVADALRWVHREELSPRIHSLMLEQIRHAHIIALNKSDLVTESQLATISMELANLNTSAPIIQTVQGKLDFSFIEKTLAVEKQPQQPIISGKHLPLSSKVITFSNPVKKSDVEVWTAALPDTVYRMKGYIPIEGVKNPMLFQYAYGMVNWMPEYVKMPERVVVIGEGIDHIDWSS
ncbi:CobW family GTP-binding protein [Sporosarcina gallistercoris]|uniref:GTP-binding protein n=1 Tax=Sporosarcina gallistercoris TaxID=2762245 RepID=A0ABR8PJH6_9BACL|nr:CobW family GTP-binding protein [Sporosarcina gallistercoris]MBD7908322.1 GTP-binding protein [Sporosarcina gallistercoris]